MAVEVAAPSGDIKVGSDVTRVPVPDGDGGELALWRVRPARRVVAATGDGAVGYESALIPRPGGDSGEPRYGGDLRSSGLAVHTSAGHDLDIIPESASVHVQQSLLVGIELVAVGDLGFQGGDLGFRGLFLRGGRSGGSRQREHKDDSRRDTELCSHGPTGDQGGGTGPGRLSTGQVLGSVVVGLGVLLGQHRVNEIACPVVVIELRHRYSARCDIACGGWPQTRGRFLLGALRHPA